MAVNWIISQYQHSWVDGRLRVLVWTDKPLHAFLHYSLSPEIYSLTAGERRGVGRLVTPVWELSDRITLEQNVRGDTDCHVFFIPVVPDNATLTFYLTATRDGEAAKSVSIPIKVQHPNPGEADPVNPDDLVDCGAFDPWTQNQKDAVGIHDDIWNETGMTGTGYFAYGMNQLSLIIGATPGSVAEIYAGNIFDLAFDHTLYSQLRAVIVPRDFTADTVFFIVHGSIDSDSCVGFYGDDLVLYGYRRWSGGGWAFPLLSPLLNDTVYLLEAKYKPNNKVEWWVNGDFIAEATTDLPDTGGHSFHAKITDPVEASVAIHFRRFMIWKQSIWTS